VATRLFPNDFGEDLLHLFQKSLFFSDSSKVNFVCVTAWHVINVQERLRVACASRKRDLQQKVLGRSRAPDPSNGRRMVIFTFSSTR